MLLGGFTAACGGSTTQGAGNHSSPPAAQSLTSEQLCAKLSPTSLEAITGTPWAAGTAPAGPAQPDTARCDLQGGQDRLGVVIHSTNGRAAVQNSLKSHLLPYQSVSGLGDQAAYASLGTGTGSANNLVVTKGDSSYLFTLVGPTIQPGQGLEPLKRIFALVAT
jgi:hypothetical protein